MVNNLNKTAEEFGMKINSAKTKVMRIAKRQGTPMRESLDYQYSRQL